MIDELAELAAVIGPAIYAAERALQRGEVDPAADGKAPLASELVAESPAMRTLLAQARRAATSDATVLLTGETGVGKSMLAKAIHGWSARGSGPFAAVHVADLPATLVESELFGHERGAFTGATQRRLGRFEVARGGTLFLDEIGEAPLPVQSKLLRVTQDGHFERVGGSATLHTDARLIAATHRDLHQAAEAGLFRRDLLYRLEIVALHVPP
ncbi:MAG: sigma-54 factor interaction domain-containing protein, partial [Deltaproteobacteria bacterium]|nr:sigma-54 factor interaction domain-containing protein [Deltaproteobacteria bacterium]